ncbi:MAG TPA: Crp/Fnr family transcriptional regulator [Usitatibacter sp.]|nr:Crp/Fnr family transcriptional regulator [Usitatibacter sp.]
MTTPIANALLAALPRADHRRLQPLLETVTVTFGEVLHEAHEQIDHVYFPTDSLVSLLTVVDRHLALEVGLVGREGMVGVAYAMGLGTTPFRAMVQGTGTAMRMGAPEFRRELAASVALQREVHLFAHALMSQVAKTAACNRFHVVQERLARWLLMTRDRMRSDEFHLTHDFLANMLGVRRVGVTKAAHALRERKLIAYSRGNITITNGRGLEGAACSCYEKPAA